MNNDILTTLGCCASIIGLTFYLSDRLDQRIEDRLGPVLLELRQISQNMNDEIAKLGIDRAQDEEDGVLSNIFNEETIESLFNIGGYGSVQEESGTLQNGETDIFSVSFDAGYEYQLVGVCETGCTDLDLVLTGSQSEEILAQDILPDDVPIIEHTPEESGDFSVNVRMYACEPEFSPCEWVVQVNRRALTL